MPALKYWDGSAWQYVAGGTQVADPTGQLVDYRVLPVSLNPGNGTQFISGLYVDLNTPSRKFLIHVWLTIGADTAGRGLDLSVQMTGASGQEQPTAAWSFTSGWYGTIAAEWPVWPTAAGLATPNRVNGWINCTPGLTIYRGIMRAVDVGPT